MIRFHLCTISFRHQLVSLPELATWAGATGFDGIELWGVHARHLVQQPGLDGRWLKSQGLGIPMVSDYLPLEGGEQEATRYTRGDRKVPVRVRLAGAEEATVDADALDAAVAMANDMERFSALEARPTTARITPNPVPATPNPTSQA